jgi:hypothetical protein
MAISRMQMDRQLYEGGGIITLTPRSKYGLGSKLKKFVRKIIPNEVSEIAVKAAPFVAPFNPLLAGAMAGIGGFDQTGRIGSSLKSGLLTYGGGQLGRYIGGAGFQEGINPFAGADFSGGFLSGIQSLGTSPIGTETGLRLGQYKMFGGTPTQEIVSSGQPPLASEGSIATGIDSSKAYYPTDFATEALPLEQATTGITTAGQTAAQTAAQKATTPGYTDLFKQVLSGDAQQKTQALKQLGGKALKDIYTKPVPGSPGETQIDKLAIGATIAGGMSYLEAKKLAEEAGIVDNADEYTEEMYNADKSRYSNYYSQILTPEAFGITSKADGGRVGYAEGSNLYGGYSGNKISQVEDPLGLIQRLNKAGGNRTPYDNISYLPSEGGYVEWDGSSWTVTSPEMIEQRIKDWESVNYSPIQPPNTLDTPTEDFSDYLNTTTINTNAQTKPTVAEQMMSPEDALTPLTPDINPLQQHFDQNQMLKDAVARGEITPEQYNVLGGYDVQQTLSPGNPVLGGIGNLIGSTGYNIVQSSIPSKDNSGNVIYEDTPFIIGEDANTIYSQTPKASQLLRDIPGDVMRNVQGGLGLISPELKQTYQDIIQQRAPANITEHINTAISSFNPFQQQQYMNYAVQNPDQAIAAAQRNKDFLAATQKNTNPATPAPASMADGGRVGFAYGTPSQESGIPSITLTKQDNTEVAGLSKNRVAQLMSLLEDPTIDEDYRKQIQDEIRLLMGKKDGGRIGFKDGPTKEGIVSINPMQDDLEELLGPGAGIMAPGLAKIMSKGVPTFTSAEKTLVIRNLAGRGKGTAAYKELGVTIPEAKAIMDNPAANLKDATILKEFIKAIMGKKDGGRMGFMMGSEVPVRQNQAGVSEMDYRNTGGFVPPIGVKEKADDIPAMLSNNEFVFTADAVRAAGGGSVNKGAQKMYSLMKQLEGKVV